MKERFIASCLVFAINMMGSHHVVADAALDGLFGIPIGGVYQLKNSNGTISDNIPKKKGLGTREGFGNGIHYYFQLQCWQKECFHC